MSESIIGSDACLSALTVECLRALHAVETAKKLLSIADEDLGAVSVRTTGLPPAFASGRKPRWRHG